MAGLASAWAIARRRPEEYRRKVDTATRCSCVNPIPDLNLSQQEDFTCMQLKYIIVN